MQHQTGEDRNQMVMFSLESSIAPDAFVRVVDAFVNVIDLKSFGFAHVECKEEGRPPYHPSILMKLYLYGYHYGIRTTRKLEREAQTNLEAIWLLSGLRPRYKTISDFRKNHAKAFREVFRRFVCLLKDWKLIEGKTVGIDSFKIRASNSLKNNFNEKKLKRNLDYIDAQIAEYERLLDESEQEEEKKKAIDEKLAERKQKQGFYKKIKKDLFAGDDEQISLTDPDSKAIVLHRNIVNVGYNIQSSTDSKHKLLAEYDTGDVNDTHALAPMAKSTKELLNADHLNVLADKGYHTGEQLTECLNNGITTYVSPKASSTAHNGLYKNTDFNYNKDDDTYNCPAGCTMTSNGTWYKHSERRKGRKARPYYIKRYTTPGCKTCKLRSKCTTSKHNGRYIDRSEYAEVIEANNNRVHDNPGYYRQRQQITEHQFGTIKRQRGYTHTNVRGKEMVLGEVGLIFIGYNLTRCISIFGTEKLIKLLKEWRLHIFNCINRLILSLYNDFLFPKVKMAI